MQIAATDGGSCAGHYILPVMNTITPRPAGALVPLSLTANAADLKMQTDLVRGSSELLAGFHD